MQYGLSLSCIELVQKSGEKTGDAEGEGKTSIQEISQRLYSDYYVEHSGCTGFAKDFRSWIKDCIASQDESVTKAADTINEAFEHMFSFVEVHPPQSTSDPSELILCSNRFRFCVHWFDSRRGWNEASRRKCSC